MGMKLIKIYLILLIIIMLTSCNYKIEEELPEDLYSAFQLLPLANELAEKYSKNKEYHLGDVRMVLSNDHRGDVEFTYIHSESRIIYVKIDTENHKIKEVVRRGYDSKLDPGKINMEAWKVDSINAVKITEEFFSETNGFKYTHMILHTPNVMGESWSVSLRNKENIYDSHIDPKTGEVLYNNIR